MGRVNLNDVEKYGGSGGGGFFSLQKDGETKEVRFMFDSIEDVDAYAVHEVEVNGKKRYVSCLREYNSPLEDCPFCAAQRRVQVKLFLPVYDIKEQKPLIWERGKTFIGKMSKLSARYPHMVSHIFEIERNGAPRDTKTTYEIYEVEGNDGTTLDDLPEVQEILGTLVLEKTPEDMEYYLQENSFPPDDDEDEKPVRRRRSRTEEEEENESTPRRTSGRKERRTPAGRRRRGEEDEEY